LKKDPIPIQRLAGMRILKKVQHKYQTGMQIFKKIEYQYHSRIDWLVIKHLSSEGRLNPREGSVVSGVQTNVGRVSEKMSKSDKVSNQFSV
jgi:hypothetical protein